MTDETTDLQVSEGVPYDPMLMGRVAEEGKCLATEWVYSAEEETEARERGLLPVLVAHEPVLTDETTRLEPTYVIINLEGVGECIDTEFEVVDNIEHIQMLIDDYKAEIASSDYMWVKTYEARILGKPDPYTEVEMALSASKRDELRIKINALEKRLS